MYAPNMHFHEEEVLERLRHYLPSQSPLKDFIHHNTLHAFQHKSFFDALRKASVIFGYRTSLSLQDYRRLYREGRISDDVLHRLLREKYTADYTDLWRERMFHKAYPYETAARIGSLRTNWKLRYKLDLDSLVFPMLFRLIGSYLDQGVSIWTFPELSDGFLSSVRSLASSSSVKLIASERASKLLMDPDISLHDLLKMVVGNEDWFEHYLFDQQFSHKGWSGMVATLEQNPSALVEARPVALRDFLMLELILEINALDQALGMGWKPMSEWHHKKVEPLFAPVPNSELFEVIQNWQESFEWSFYDQVLKGIQQYEPPAPKPREKPLFQAFFCIDDRECSIRRYIEAEEPRSQTFGTPGFFGVPVYFQPQDGGLLIKLCPANATPQHFVRERKSEQIDTQDLSMNRRNSGLFSGFIVSQTLGFWAALKLAWNIFRPSISASSNSSFRHMHPESYLQLEYVPGSDRPDGLREGFTVDEMVSMVSAVLRSIGLTDGFAPLVYVMSHGSSSVNNTHYAGYDCGACSGRPGSVNARLFAAMANHPEVRAALRERDIVITDETWFMSGLHDTATDEVMFYDLNKLNSRQMEAHQAHVQKFERALHRNAKERSRRFILTNSKDDAALVHEKVKQRAFSLFEPRPEFNHATNALCLIGRREMSRHLFLDRRSFLNSYDPLKDPDGSVLTALMRPIGPVCGGINLEYFFSRIDNPKLGAGTKLPHNVVGLIGVANGVEGDLRPGLPAQMVEIHDPVRLLVIIEQTPALILRAIRDTPEVYQWYVNDWVKLCSVHPQTRAIEVFRNGAFVPYQPVSREIPKVDSLETILEFNEENLPVMVLEED